LQKILTLTETCLDKLIREACDRGNSEHRSHHEGPEVTWCLLGRLCPHSQLSWNGRLTPLLTDSLESPPKPPCLSERSSSLAWKSHSPGTSAPRVLCRAQIDVCSLPVSSNHLGEDE
jgi:hypothetical protein